MDDTKQQRGMATSSAEGIKASPKVITQYTHTRIAFPTHESNPSRQMIPSADKFIAHTPKQSKAKPSTPADAHTHTHTHKSIAQRRAG
jgi:hypothetical protein